MHPQVSKARASVAALSRCVRNGERPADDPDLVTARRDLNAARLESYIEKVLAQAPPLSDEQRNRLAELLRPARRELAGGARR